MIRPILLFIALLCAGIGTGGAYTTFFDFNPEDTKPAFWVAHLQHAVPRIGIPLFVVQPVALLATIASAVLARKDRRSFWFFVAAGIAFLVAGVVTRFGNVPINFQIATWATEALPANFLEVQQRWWTFHVVRCACLAVGLVSLILAVLTRSSSESQTASS